MMVQIHPIYLTKQMEEKFYDTALILHHIKFINFDQNKGFLRATRCRFEIELRALKDSY